MARERKLRVAVVFGGRSAEHEISILSARFIVESLNREKFDPVLIGIDKSGRWHLQEEALLLGSARDPRLVKLNQAMPDVALAAHPLPSGEAALAIEGSGQAAIDVVFPVLHGPMGEDGSVQGLLELAGVPYVGSGVLGSAVGMDKDVMKRLLEQAEIPIVRHVTVRHAAWRKGNEEIIAQCEELGSPVFVKPANLGSSVGVRRAKTRDELVAAIDHAFEFDTKAIIEEAVVGVREIECAVLGDEDPIASIPGEIVVGHEDGFYSYAAKYIDEHGAKIRIPAELTAAQASSVQLLALQTFRALEGSGLARVDFFLSQDGRLFVNEINTLPGFTAISMYPKLWETSGIPARDLVERLIEIAMARGKRRSQLRTTA
ncbi:MAG TPA: D-alanine--D-alanine ligase family protein [Polyangiaceae bacterium]|nr:D-alanine--D-alanine ligase family protein [Polyangiaceae bacterium]